MIAKAWPVAALLAALPFAAAAQQAEGNWCDQGLSNTARFLDQNSANLSEQARRDAQRRLDIARQECSEDPSLGAAHLSQLQASLGVPDAQQTAELPWQEPATGDIQ